MTGDATMDHFVLPMVTAATAAVLALMQIALMFFAAAGRGKYATGLGDGGHDGLLRRIRMHGNLAENAPLFLILLGLVEMSGKWGWAVLPIAVAFICARVAHIIGLSLTSGASRPRVIGVLGTALTVTALALLLVATVARQMLHT